MTTWTRKKPGYPLCLNSTEKSGVAVDGHGLVALVERVEEKWRMVEV